MAKVVLEVRWLAGKEAETCAHGAGRGEQSVRAHLRKNNRRDKGKIRR